MKVNFDRRHATGDLPYIADGQEVWIPDRKQYGTVQDRHSDISYIVGTPTGTYRHHVEVPPPPPQPDNPPDRPDPHGNRQVVTISGRAVTRPKRYDKWTRRWTLNAG